jgi:hypothetical protein
MPLYVKKYRKTINGFKYLILLFKANKLMVMILIFIGIISCTSFNQLVFDFVNQPCGMQKGMIDCQQGAFKVMTQKLLDKQDPVSIPGDAIEYALINFGKLERNCEYFDRIVIASQKALKIEGYASIYTGCPRPLMIQLRYRDDVKDLIVLLNDNSTISVTNSIRMDQ